MSSELDFQLSGQAAFVISLFVIFILSVAFGLCLRWIGSSPLVKQTRKLRKVHRTVIRHRDPTEVVRDFEHEDEFERDDPLDFEEEVIDIEEEEDLDTGFEVQEPVARRTLQPKPLDLTKLHHKVELKAHEGRIYRTQREIALVGTTAYTHLRGLMEVNEDNPDPKQWLNPGYKLEEVQGYIAAQRR